MIELLQVIRLLFSHSLKKSIVESSLRGLECDITEVRLVGGSLPGDK